MYVETQNESNGTVEGTLLFSFLGLHFCNRFTNLTVFPTKSVIGLFFFSFNVYVWPMLNSQSRK